MQIRPIQQNNTSFGMALYMPKPSEYSKILKPKTAVETEIFKKLVSYGEELEKSRPQLELLAKDVDVHITPQIDPFNGYAPDMNQQRLSGYYCTVTKVGKNKLSRKFNKKYLNVATAISFYNTPLESISKTVIDSTKSIKRTFIEEGLINNTTSKILRKLVFGK